MSRERKLDLVGLALIILSVFTLLSMLSSSNEGFSAGWVALLQRGFGWGMVIVPLAALLGGLALVLRRLGDRMPAVSPEQLVGVGLLYIGFLAVGHAFTGARTFAEGFAIARQGKGGGLVGAVIFAALQNGLGGSGTVILLIAWFLIGMMFTFGITFQQVMETIMGAVRWLWERAAPRLKPARKADRVPRAASRSVSGGVGKKTSSVVEVKEAALETSDQEEDIERVWTLPRLEAILEEGREGRVDDTFDRERATLIEETLKAFGAPARVVEINSGPTITQFGVEPAFLESRSGRRTKVKVSKISALADDLALALAAPSIRIEAPVPGKGFVGIEVPNPEINMVALRDVMEAEAFTRIRSRLALGLGMDVSGHAVAADLGAMPHLLIAGTTGSGKSVCVNAIIASLLLQNTPNDLRFLMVDPKRVELTYYNGIPHLLSPVVVELDRVVPMLQWVLHEMDERYKRFSKEGVRHIQDFNRRMAQSERKGMYYMVVVIDELADLMMMAPDETERVITRLAQLARATGIHLVIATQRPSVDVVTGLIKANFPARIAFAVASSVDSRVIIDQPGAERLLGRGDMLLQTPDAAAPLRMQGAYMSEGELKTLIRYWTNQSLGGEHTRPTTPAKVSVTQDAIPLEQVPMWEEFAEKQDRDSLYDEAVVLVRKRRRASISMLQRRMRIGYTRAARIIDQMEENGIIGPATGGSKPREVLDYGGISPGITPET